MAVNKGPCLYCLRIKLPNAAALKQTTGLFADTSIKYGHNQDPTVLKVIKINYNEKKNSKEKNDERIGFPVKHYDNYYMPKAHGSNRWHNYIDGNSI